MEESARPLPLSLISTDHSTHLNPIICVLLKGEKVGHQMHVGRSAPQLEA